jgi:hypothetical protein
MAGLEGHVDGNVARMMRGRLLFVAASHRHDARRRQEQHEHRKHHCQKSLHSSAGFLHDRHLTCPVTSLPYDIFVGIA